MGFATTPNHFGFGNVTTGKQKKNMTRNEARTKDKK